MPSSYAPHQAKGANDYFARRDQATQQAQQPASTMPQLPNFNTMLGGVNGGVGGSQQPSAYSTRNLPQSTQSQGMFGGQFGGGQPTSTPINYQAPAMNLQAQRDPQLQAMYDAYTQQRSGLAAGNDRDAINAMQRQRDDTSGRMRETEMLASRRGLGPQTGVSQYLQSQQAAQGARNNTSLNASLTSDARSQQLAALGGQTGAAQASSAALQGQQNYALDQWKAQQQAAQAQAQLQAMQTQNAWGNQLGLLNWYSGMVGNLM